MTLKLKFVVVCHNGSGKAEIPWAEMDKIGKEVTVEQ